MTQAQVYVHARALAPAKRANPDEARLLARLTDRALKTAEEFGEECSLREARGRVRENLQYVRGMAEKTP